MAKSLGIWGAAVKIHTQMILIFKVALKTYRKVKKNVIPSNTLNYYLARHRAQYFSGAWRLMRKKKCSFSKPPDTSLPHHHPKFSGFSPQSFKKFLYFCLFHGFWWVMVLANLFSPLLHSYIIYFLPYLWFELFYNWIF